MLLGIVLIIVLAAAGIILTIFANANKKNVRNSNRLKTFINHPDCFVRVTDKTNYDILISEFGTSDSNLLDKIKDRLEMRIYDIRSSLYNLPQNILPQYKAILSFPTDIYELFCMMETFEQGSGETAYIYKGNNDMGAEINDTGVCSFGFSARSIAAFISLGILKLDRSQSQLKQMSDDFSMQELIETAQAHGITLIGNTKEELMKSAFKTGLLSLLQINNKSIAAYKITDVYFLMEKDFFEAYCIDIVKNLKDVHKAYSETILNTAIKANTFSKTRPANRLTAMLEQIKAGSSGSFSI